MREMTGGMVGLPRGADRGLGLQTSSSRIPIGMYFLSLLIIWVD